MIECYSSAPQPAFRLIPSRFPPIGLFDTVATAADLLAAMELAGWTNDRLVSERLKRLPQSQWVYGGANSSVIMASFLHASPTRFNGADLGAWCAGDDIRTSVAEVAHHLRRETVARSVPAMKRTYRTYVANLLGDDYRDIRGDQVNLGNVYKSDSYADSQVFGAIVRQARKSGILFDSLRWAGGSNIVSYHPSNVTNVLQGDYYEIQVEADDRTLIVKRLTI